MLPLTPLSLLSDVNCLYFCDVWLNFVSKLHGSYLFRGNLLLKQVNFIVRYFSVPFLLFVVLSSWTLVVKAENQVTVKPGQSLIKIMRQVYPDQRSRWPVLMREIVQSNPASFENGDPRTLKVGSILSLPEKSTAKSKVIKRARAATVKSVVGSVTLFDDKKKTSELKQGSQVYVGDQILTSDSGMATLSFVDGASLELRCNSLLTVDEYKMRTRGSQSTLSLLKGSLSTRTGRIGKRGHDKYELKTPVGNVTTTQAEYGIRVHQSQACAKQADVDTDGLYVAVLNGKVLLSNDGGEFKVTSGNAALSSQKSVAPVEIAAFSGMVFGDKYIAKPVVVKSKPVKRVVEEVAEEEPLKEDNGVPYWWMIAAAVILGVTF